MTVDTENDVELKDWKEAFTNGEPTREKTNTFLNKHPMKFKCGGCGKITNINKVEDWKNCDCGSTAFEMID
jgi:hypothetical protein